MSWQWTREDVDLLADLLAQEVRKLPVLAVQEQDYADLLQDFFCERGPSLTAKAAASGALSRDQVAKYMRTSVRHWLIDRARKTDLGALYRQVERRLELEAVFEQVPAGAPGEGWWHLTGTSAEPWSGDPAELDDAARAVPIHPKRGGAQRRAALGTASEVKDLLAAILAKAGGSLPTVQLVDVVRRRIPATLSPQEVALDDDVAGGVVLADRDADPESLYLDREADLDNAVKAVEVYAQLSDWEWRVLPVCDDLEKIGQVLDCGRSTANNRRQQLGAHLLELNANIPLSADVMRELVELCS